MTAVDTNVVVRLLTADDAKQAAAARALFASGPVWIAKTVWLETAWVLCSLYGFEDGAIHDAFSRLLGLVNVHTEDKQSLIAALQLSSQGIDFADAMHLTSRPAGAAFVSFDHAFVRRARRAGAIDVSGVG
jgi:predicted nucleic-acid-binding protein